MNNSKSIGKFIAEKRKQAGLTQETFASMLDITPQAVSKWENEIGLPDITLLPSIAKIFNVSIDEIFNRSTPKKAFQFPEKLNGLPFIFSKGNKACYSSKEVECIDDDGNIRFKDGSIGNMTNCYVENRGKGEIRFLESEEPEEQISAPEKIDQELDAFNSISMSLNIVCEVKVLKATYGRFEAKGAPKFMERLQFEVKNDRLHVSFKNGNNNNSGGNNNKIIVYTPFDKGEEIAITVNGASTCNIEPDFVKTILSINGSGDINAENTETLSATINGSGDINLDSASENVRFSINGSGDISLNNAKDISAQVNGSGDVSITNATGSLSATIRGSGDMNLGGKVEKFTCNVFGCGDIDAEKLTASTAEIVLEGSSDVTIRHILVSSTEKISKESTLTVLKRG